jgi:hypothetical protein
MPFANAKSSTSRRRIGRVLLLRAVCAGVKAAQMLARNRVRDELRKPHHMVELQHPFRVKIIGSRAAMAREIGRTGDDHPHDLIANAGDSCRKRT